MLRVRANSLLSVSRELRVSLYDAMSSMVTVNNTRTNTNHLSLTHNRVDVTSPLGSLRLSNRISSFGWLMNGGELWSSPASAALRNFCNEEYLKMIGAASRRSDLSSRKGKSALTCFLEYNSSVYFLVDMLLVACDYMFYSRPSLSHPCRDSHTLSSPYSSAAACHQGERNTHNSNELSNNVCCRLYSTFQNCSGVNQVPLRAFAGRSPAVYFYPAIRLSCPRLQIKQD